MKKWYAKLLSLAFLFPALTSASALPHVFVDEIGSDDPRHDEGTEWIEITNRTRAEVDTRGWILPSFSSGGESLTLNVGILGPNERLIVPLVDSESVEEPKTPSLPPELSEFVSDPEDGGEWIEFYNPHDQDIDLSAFKISDASRKKVPLVGIVKPQQYFVANLSSSLLNNGGDTVDLIDESGDTLDSVTYADETVAKKGESLARNEEDLWSIAVPTPGLPNRFPVVELEVTAKEEDVEVTKDNEPEAEQPEEPQPGPVVETEPTYTGTVTASPGLFGSQIAYMNGYQLYLYKADWPELAVGDTIRVKGELGESRSETRIKLASGNDLSVTGSKALEPEIIGTGAVRSTKTGTLVTMTGKVTARNDRTLTIEDAEGTVESVFIDAIDLDLKTYLEQEVRITGIIRTLNANPRLYPRTAEDLVLVPTEEPIAEPESEPGQTLFTASNRSLPKPLIGGGFIAATAGSGMLFYLKHKLKLFT